MQTYVETVHNFGDTAKIIVKDYSTVFGYYSTAQLIIQDKVYPEDPFTSEEALNKYVGEFKQVELEVQQLWSKWKPYVPKTEVKPLEEEIKTQPNLPVVDKLETLADSIVETVAALPKEDVSALLAELA